MIDIVKAAIAAQYGAALETLSLATRLCPDSLWQEPAKGEGPFSQVAFHAVFYGDCYLGQSDSGFKEQAFHVANPGKFGDYEEMEDREPSATYARAWIAEYLEFVRDKARRAIAAETEESLSAPCGFDWLAMSRLELYLYGARHLQHHAAQLSLRVQLATGTGAKWVRAAAPATGA